MIKTIKYNSISEFVNKNNINLEDVKRIINGFSGDNIMVIGDFILNIYTKCHALGKISKTSTLSVKKEKSDYFYGGAGLFANILSKTECKVFLISQFGNEKNLIKVIDKKKPKNLKIKKIFEKRKPTTSKERFWVDEYKLLQVDVLDNKFGPKKNIFSSSKIINEN